MQKPTKILSIEHQNILRVIEKILNQCDTIESGKKIDAAFFQKAINFIKNYADKFHHAKEEDILFKELCKPNVAMHCNPVEQMLYEHNLGRNFVKEMAIALKKNDKIKLVESARGYCQLLQEHIFKEDNILYPMADEVLNQNAQTAMLKKFEEVEKNFDKKLLENI